MKFFSLSSAFVSAALVFLTPLNSNALTWSPLTLLNSDGASDFQDDAVVDAANDGNGHWVAVWHRIPGTVSSANIFYATSSDDGHTWAPAKALSDVAITETSPRVSTDRKGHWVAVWTRTTLIPSPGGLPSADIVASQSSDNGQTWTTPAYINPNGQTPTVLDAVADLDNDGAGKWVIAAQYADITSGQTSTSYFRVTVSVSTDNGASWTVPTLLDSDSLGSLDYNGNIPSIATDHQGNWVVTSHAFVRQDPGPRRIFRILAWHSDDNATTWSEPVQVSGESASSDSSSFYPSIAADSSGRFLISWENYETTYTQNQFAKSFMGGSAWTSPETIPPIIPSPAQNILSPFSVATDNAGNWLVVRSDKSLATVSDPNRGAIEYSQSQDFGDSWSPFTLLDPGAASRTESSYNPIAVLGQGSHWLALCDTAHAPGAGTGTDRDITYSETRLPSPPSTDLQVTKTSDPTATTVGNVVDYEITVSNNGPIAATDVVLTDPVPSGLTVQSADASQGQTQINGTTVTAQLGTIQVGQSATVSVTALASQAGTFDNIAYASGNEFDPVPGNNIGVATTKISLDGADLTAALHGVRLTVINSRSGRKTSLSGSVRVTNIGNAGTQASITKVVLANNSDPNAATESMTLATLSTRALSAGGVARLTFRTTLPIGTPTAGMFVIAIANADGSADDVRTDNNTAVFGPLP